MDNGPVPLTATLDPACAEAVDLARDAAAADAGAAGVGEYDGVESEGERAVVHYFASLDPAYRGWRWAVTLVRAARAARPTVAEVVLLPGPDSVLAPPWIPWQQRLQPGDLGVGDVLPTPPDDPRLVPNFFTGADESEAEVAFELGLGRARVLSPEGRAEAAERWHTGRPGPAAAIAKAVPLTCGTCGFLVQIRGSLRQAFGVCANAFAPDDGRVVSMDHGCGAHSEIEIRAVEVVGEPLLDEFGYEPAAAEGSVSEGDSPEPLGHS
jgi:hypothetical protein